MWLVWDAFKELNQTRTNFGYGGNPITYLEILAWKTLTNSIISAKEIEILKLVDNIFLVHSANRIKE